MTTAARIEPRLAVVDGFRGIAILSVLLGHCLLPGPSAPLTRLLYEGGKWLWLGVDLFFVLSGFLITRILISSVGRPDYFRAFYARRALRILPASYLVLLIAFVLFPLLRPDLAGTGFQRTWPYFAAYVQNWLLIAHPPEIAWDGLHHTWSLAIEEQFYLAWPLVIRAVAPHRRELFCLAAALGVLVLKLSLWQGGAEWGTMFAATFTRADGLLLGAWVAVVTVQGRSRYFSSLAVDITGWSAHLLFAALFVAFMGTLVSSAVVALVTPTAAVIFAFWLLRSLQAPHALTPMLESRLLGWLARYSYGIYLIHWPILSTLRARLYGKGLLAPWIKTGTNWELLAIGVFTVAVTVLAAVIMFQLVERRFLDLKRRWPMPGV
jgi:peptidoglycan/LPS O-acetylase OafA/YrhL